VHSRLSLYLRLSGFICGCSVFLLTPENAYRTVGGRYAEP
jgi:hypothetical protein